MHKWHSLYLEWQQIAETRQQVIGILAGQLQKAGIKPAVPITEHEAAPAVEVVESDEWRGFEWARQFNEAARAELDKLASALPSRAFVVICTAGLPEQDVRTFRFVFEPNHVQVDLPFLLAVPGARECSIVSDGPESLARRLKEMAVEMAGENRLVVRVWWTAEACDDGDSDNVYIRARLGVEPCLLGEPAAGYADVVPEEP